MKLRNNLNILILVLVRKLQNLRFICKEEGIISRGNLSPPLAFEFSTSRNGYGRKFYTLYVKSWHSGMEAYCSSNITQALWCILPIPPVVTSVSLLFFFWLQFSTQCIPNQSNCVKRMMLSSRWQWPRCFGHAPSFLLLFHPLHISEPPPVLHLCILVLTGTQSLGELKDQSQSQNNCDHITTVIKCDKHLYYRRSSS